MSDQNTGIVKWIAGILATVIAGVIVYYLTEGQREPTIPDRPTEAVEFTILNQLGPMQVSEDVQVYIEGKLVANLLVNQQQATDSAKIKVSGVGNYAYTILADGVFMNQFSQPYRTQGRGDGVIEVSKGSVFELAMTPHGVRLISR